MAATMNAATFMGNSWKMKIPSRISQIWPWRKCSTSQRNWWPNRKRLIMWTKFIGKFIHGNSCYWLVTKPSSIFNARNSTSSHILCCAMERSINIRIPTKLGRKRLNGSSLTQGYGDFDGSNVEPSEFEWNIVLGFTTLQLYGKVRDLLSRVGEAPETLKGRILFMSMFNDISCDGKGSEEECVAKAKVVSILVKKFGIGQWSFIGPGSEKKWSSMEDNSHQGIWDHIAEEVLLEFGESWHPTFRATTPLSRCKLKSEGHGKLSIHFIADYPTIVFFSHNFFFCQSAQSLRSSCKHVWRIWNPSR